MVPSTQPTHEMMQACMPTRSEKSRIARAFGYKSESSTYKWCEDPDGSGRPNPLDQLELILDHARLYHPAAAFAIGARIMSGNARAVGGKALGRAPVDLLTDIQPAVEAETTEALHALTAALRRLCLGQGPELAAVKTEVDEAIHELQRAQAMLEAAIHHDQQQPA